MEKKQSVKEIMNEYNKIKQSGGGGSEKPNPSTYKTPPSERKPQTPTDKTQTPKFKDGGQEEIEKMQKETDPDLLITHEIVKLPSKGMFYQTGLSEVEIEYMTSKDEDLLTTPSLIESGKVIDLLLKRKIKTPNVNIDDLLPGDKSAVILNLRTSSYGPEYHVEVPDPRTGKYIKQKVDLFKLNVNEPSESPDENGHFSVELPKRQKTVKFKLLTSGEEKKTKETADAMKEQYNQEYSEINTTKLKTAIVSIDGKTDRGYINRFVDAMPAWDSTTIKRKMLEVSPGIDLKYTFKASDGFEFEGYLVIGPDFFFPSV